MAAGDATHRLLPVHDRGENRGEKRERKGGHPNPRPPPPLLYSDMKNSEYTASAWGTCLPRVPHSREAGRLAEARWLSFSLHLLPLYPSLPLLLPHIRSSLSLSLRLSRLRPSGERTGVELGIGFVTSVGKDLI